MGLLVARKGLALVEPGGKRAKKRWSMGGRVEASFMKSLGDAIVGGGGGERWWWWVGEKVRAWRVNDWGEVVM